MKRWLVSPIVAALSTSLLFAQGEVKKVRASQAAAKQEYEALMAKYETAVRTFSKVRKKVLRSKEYRQARAERDREMQKRLLENLKSPKAEFVPRFLELATRFPNTSVAADSMLWVMSNAQSNERAVKIAIQTLTTRHLASPQMAAVAGNHSTLARVLGRDGAKKVLGSIIDGNPDKRVVTVALFSRIELLKGRGASADDAEAAEKDLEQLRKIAPQLVPADGARFAAERLKVGAKAPDILGSDIDGVTFMLSDYRGKVVVLDFWGDW